MSGFENKFQLDDQIVLLTGGLGILGQNFARGFLDSGAVVAICDLAPDTAEQTQGLFPELYSTGRVRGYSLDIANFAQTKDVVAEINRSLGNITHLMNNAASKGSDIHAFMSGPNDFDMKTWAEVMSVNVDAGFHLAQIVGNNMIAKKIQGSMTFVSSIYGIIAPNPDLYEGSQYMGTQINTPPVYSASKSAVIGLCRYLAAYWGEHGIRVNCLTPGGVFSGQNKAFQDRYSARVPLKRLAQPHEMVGPAVFLASDAASYITGTNIVVDGGFSQW